MALAAIAPVNRTAAGEQPAAAAISTVAAEDQVRFGQAMAAARTTAAGAATGTQRTGSAASPGDRILAGMRSSSLRTIASDSTGWVTPEAIAELERRGSSDRAAAARQLRLVEDEDGNLSLTRMIEAGQEVYPTGISSPVFKAGDYGVVTLDQWIKHDKWPDKPFSGKLGFYLMGGTGAAGGEEGIRNVAGASEGWSIGMLKDDGNGLVKIYYYGEDRAEWGGHGGHGAVFTGDVSMKLGEWNHLRLAVKMNSPGKSDGSIALLVNGEVAVQRSGMMIVEDPTKAEGLWTRNRDMGGGNENEHIPGRDIVRAIRDVAISIGGTGALGDALQGQEAIPGGNGGTIIDPGSPGGTGGAGSGGSGGYEVDSNGNLQLDPQTLAQMLIAMLNPFMAALRENR